MRLTKAWLLSSVSFMSTSHVINAIADNVLQRLEAPSFWGTVEITTRSTSPWTRTFVHDIKGSIGDDSRFVGLDNMTVTMSDQGLRFQEAFHITRDDGQPLVQRFIETWTSAPRFNMVDFQRFGNAVENMTIFRQGSGNMAQDSSRQDSTGFSNHRLTLQWQGLFPLVSRSMKSFLWRSEDSTRSEYVNFNIVPRPNLIHKGWE
jgi:uncharacterized phage-associated protein